MIPHSDHDNIPEQLSREMIAVPGWKRVLDIALLLLAMPVVLPLMLLIALVIRLVSRGPVLFRQERVGYLGKPFMCFKFRTMRVGADITVHADHLSRLIDSDVPMVKMDVHGDPRVIPFGWLLRASGLDELPQLINVFRGEMSVVGPRPCMPYEFNKYLSWQKERFNTLPGLTGLWQVSGKNRTTFVEMIRLDIDYASRKTVWLDVGIILRTVPAVIEQILETVNRRTASSRLKPSDSSRSARGASQYSIRGTEGAAIANSSTEA